MQREVDARSPRHFSQGQAKGIMEPATASNQLERLGIGSHNLYDLVLVSCYGTNPNVCSPAIVCNDIGLCGPRPLHVHPTRLAPDHPLYLEPMGCPRCSSENPVKPKSAPLIVG